MRKKETQRVALASVQNERKKNSGSSIIIIKSISERCMLLKISQIHKTCIEVHFGLSIRFRCVQMLDETKLKNEEKKIGNLDTSYSIKYLLTMYIRKFFAWKINPCLLQSHNQSLNDSRYENIWQQTLTRTHKHHRARWFYLLHHIVIIICFSFFDRKNHDNAKCRHAHYVWLLK